MEENKALTIEYLNTLNSKVLKLNHKQLQHRNKVDECLTEVGNILRREWHNKSEKLFFCDDYPFAYEYDVFNEVKEMYKYRGIEITMHLGTKCFGFKLI